MKRLFVILLVLLALCFAGTVQAAEYKLTSSSSISTVWRPAKAHAFRIVNIYVALSAVGGTSENLDFLLTNSDGTSVYGLLDRTNMETHQYVTLDDPFVVGPNGYIKFSYTNTNSRTVNIFVEYERITYNEWLAGVE